MRTLLLVPFLLVPACAIAYAQPDPDVIAKYDFEQGTKPWQTLDQGAVLGLCMDAENVREGTSSLQIEYRQQEFQEGGQKAPSGLLMLPTPNGLFDARSMHFSLKARRAMPFVVELDGIRFSCPIWVPAGKWIDVDLPLDGFAVEDGPADDPTKRLRPGNVTSIALFDATPFLYRNAKTGGGLPRTPPELGDQVTWLDDFQLRRTEPPPEKPSVAVTDGEPVVIATGALVFVRGMVMGGTGLSLTAADPDAGRAAIKLAYALASDTVLVLYQTVPQACLRGSKRLEFDAKVDHDSRFALALEQSRWPRQPGTPMKAEFVHVLNLAAADGWKHFVVPFAEFGLEGSAPPVAVDASLIISLGFVDVTARTTHQDVTNTVRLANIIAVR